MDGQLALPRFAGMLAPRELLVVDSAEFRLVAHGVNVKIKASDELFPSWFRGASAPVAAAVAPEGGNAAVPAAATFVDFAAAPCPNSSGQAGGDEEEEGGRGHRRTGAGGGLHSRLCLRRRMVGGRASGEMEMEKGKLIIMTRSRAPTSFRCRCSVMVEPGGMSPVEVGAP